MKAAALIIAGGRGTRFWPASRRHFPKPLFKLDGRTSLITATVKRLQPLIPAERTFVLVAAEHQQAFARELKGTIPGRNLLVEPAGRGTTVAIAYGAAKIRRALGEDAVLALMWADHHIVPEEKFRLTLRKAIALANSHKALVTIGITPTRAEPGYGYQQLGEPVGTGFVVKKFIEKPKPAVALRMFKSGKFLWNAGIFAMRSDVLQAELAAHCPELASSAATMVSARGEPLARMYRSLKFDSFDRAIVERSSRVLAVRAAFDWHDVGSWDGLWEVMQDADCNAFTGNVIALDSTGSLAHSERRLMVLLGVQDLVAVDTGDALLITTREKSQQVGIVIKELERRKLERYL